MENLLPILYLKGLADLRETDGLESTREQRCWLHKMGNILNDLPKRVQPRAKGLLREIKYAETLSAANRHGE